MDKLKHLQNAVYEATSDDEGYAALAGHLATAFDSITSWSLDYGAQQPVKIGTSFDVSDLVGGYEEYYFERDLWRLRSQDWAGNVAVNCERFVTQEEMNSSEMYNDFIKPMGRDIFHCMGIKLPSPDKLNFTNLSMQRVRSQASYTDEDERLLQAAQPYLSQMVAARWRIATLGDQIATVERELASGLDVLLLVDSRMRVVWKNAQATGLSPDAPVALSASGFLRCAREEDATALAQAIQQATMTFPAGGSMGMRGRNDIRSWRIAVDPARGYKDSKLAMVRVRDVSAFIARQVRAASNAFSLTAAETRLAGALLAGSTLASYAEFRGIGMPTVRAQLAAILAKSGAGRQAEFVAIAASLPA